MAMQSLTMMRCERCRAVVSSAEAPAMIRAGTPCGVCGGVLALAGQHGRAAALGDGDPEAPSQRTPSTARRGGMLPRRR
jgi:PHP family Zn ribbon phosphoesterase